MSGNTAWRQKDKHGGRGLNVGGDFPHQKQFNYVNIFSNSGFVRILGALTYSLAFYKHCYEISGLASPEQVFSDRREANTGAKAAYYSFALFIYVFLIIIASITVFNIMNIMNNSVANRKNRYGVMKAIGMTGKQLQRMVIVEAASYTICGCLTGLIISLPIHRLIFKMLITSRWGLDWQVPFGMLAVIIGITILSTGLSVIRPVKTLNKMSVTDIVNAQ